VVARRSTTVEFSNAADVDLPLDAVAALDGISARA
jgi:hypothetical protein